MSSPGPLPAEFVLPKLPPLQSASVFGQTIRYYDIGSGSPLVLIHGIGGDADDWAFCLEALSASHRVLALDLLGFGRSSKPMIEYHIEVFVEVMEQFLHSLGIEQAVLVGGSLGGWVAAAFALKFSKKVNKLILVDAAGVWGDMKELPVDLRVSTRAHLRKVFQAIFYNKSLATDSLIDFAYQLHLERGDGYTIDNLLKNLRDGRERLDEVIGNLRVSTLIVWGEQDQMIPLRIGQRIHELIAGSSLEIIPECGHLPALEKPAEFVRQVVAFLNG